MENERLIAQIASMLKEQKHEIINEVSATFREQNQAMLEYIDKRITDAKNELRTEIFFKIENDVEKRLDALTDGYKLTHEKQWKVERKLEALEARIAAIEKYMA